MNSLVSESPINDTFSPLRNFFGFWENSNSFFIKFELQNRFGSLTRRDNNTYRIKSEREFRRKKWAGLNAEKWWKKQGERRNNFSAVENLIKNTCIKNLALCHLMFISYWSVNVFFPPLYFNMKWLDNWL